MWPATDMALYVDRHREFYKKVSVSTFWSCLYVVGLIPFSAGTKTYPCERSNGLMDKRKKNECIFLLLDTLSKVGKYKSVLEYFLRGWPILWVVVEHSYAPLLMMPKCRANLCKYWLSLPLLPFLWRWIHRQGDNPLHLQEEGRLICEIRSKWSCDFAQTEEARSQKKYCLSMS